MTNEEVAAKVFLESGLQESGYVTYAKILHKLELVLIDDNDCIAYFMPEKLAVVINRELDDRAVFTITRHELMHYFLSHYERGKEYIADNYPQYEYSLLCDILNIAADYEISNLSYSEMDKIIIRKIKLGDTELRGLVTEDDHPGWVDKSYEEMIDLLIQENKDSLDSVQSFGKAWNDAATSGCDIPDEIKDKMNELIEDIEKECKQGQSGSKNSTCAGENLKGTVVEGSGEGLKSIREVRDYILNRLIADDKIVTSKHKFALQRASEQRKYLDYLKGIGGFENALRDFVDDYLGNKRIRSWQRLNATADAAGILRKGKRFEYNFDIPLINVYFDRSGSWGPEKTLKGKNALAILESYEKKKKLRLNIKYFAERISMIDDGSAGGGTKGTPILEDIKETKPDNVIIMTDSDINDCQYSVEVPGYAWFLFCGGESENIMSGVNALAGSRKYIIE